MTGLIPYNRRNLSVRTPMPGNFYNMLDDFFSDNWLNGRNLFRDNFKLDVKEDAEKYTVEAELPGVKKEEIGISMENGCLSLSVRREEHAEEEGKNYLHRERQFTSMGRSIYLADADEQNVSAKLEDGVLRVSVNKQAKDAGKTRIEIE